MRALVIICVALAANSSQARDIRLREVELIGSWLPLRSCPNAEFTFARDHSYDHWCFDMSRDGKWSIRDGSRIILVRNIPGAKEQQLVILAFQRHSRKPSLTVRYDDGSTQTWLKKT